VLRRKAKSSEEKKHEEQQKLGAMIESMYDAINPDRKSLYRTAFIKGMLSGVGGVIGATIIIALLLWLLSLFAQVPILGHFVESVRRTLENH
jgi:uncharacterized membrane protein YfcA